MSPPGLSLWVALGSALGAVLRYLLGLAVDGIGGLPWETLLVNASGSLMIGMVAALTLPGSAFPCGPAMRHFLMPGLLGGYTTFSIFSLQTMGLIQAGEQLLAAVNILANMALALGAVWAGYALGAAITRPGPSQN